MKNLQKFVKENDTDLKTLNALKDILEQLLWANPYNTQDAIQIILNKLNTKSEVLEKMSNELYDVIDKALVWNNDIYDIEVNKLCGISYQVVGYDGGTSYIPHFEHDTYIDISQSINGEYVICNLGENFVGVLPCVYNLGYDSSTDGIGILKFKNKKVTFIPNEALTQNSRVTFLASGILRYYIF